MTVTSEKHHPGSKFASNSGTGSPGPNRYTIAQSQAAASEQKGADDLRASASDIQAHPSTNGDFNVNGFEEGVDPEPKSPKLPDSSLSPTSLLKHTGQEEEYEKDESVAAAPRALADMGPLEREFEELGIEMKVNDEGDSGGAVRPDVEMLRSDAPILAPGRIAGVGLGEQVHPDQSTDTSKSTPDIIEARLRDIAERYSDMPQGATYPDFRSARSGHRHAHANSYPVAPSPAHVGGQSVRPAPETVLEPELPLQAELNLAPSTHPSGPLLQEPEQDHRPVSQNHSHSSTSPAVYAYASAYPVAYSPAPAPGLHRSLAHQHVYGQQGYPHPQGHYYHYQHQPHPHHPYSSSANSSSPPNVPPPGDYGPATGPAPTGLRPPMPLGAGPYYDNRPSSSNVSAFSSANSPPMSPNIILSGGYSEGGSVYPSNGGGGAGGIWLVPQGGDNQHQWSHIGQLSHSQAPASAYSQPHPYATSPYSNSNIDTQSQPLSQHPYAYPPIPDRSPAYISMQHPHGNGIPQQYPPGEHYQAGRYRDGGQWNASPLNGAPPMLPYANYQYIEAEEAWGQQRLWGNGHRRGGYGRGSGRGRGRIGQRPFFGIGGGGWQQQPHSMGRGGEGGFGILPSTQPQPGFDDRRSSPWNNSRPQPPLHSRQMGGSIGDANNNLNSAAPTGAVPDSVIDTGDSPKLPQVTVERKEYHPAAPANRSEWVMWVGNVPNNVTHEEMWKFFNRPLESAEIPAGFNSKSSWFGVSSIFLISRSSCAFVNLKTAEDLDLAIAYFNGKSLRPWDPRCPKLVCRVRKTDDDLRAGVGGQRGLGMHTRYIKAMKEKGIDESTVDLDQVPVSPGSGIPSLPSIPLSPAVLEAPPEGEGRRRESILRELPGGITPAAYAAWQKAQSGTGTHSFASTNSSFLVRNFPKRYFILKSSTIEELDVSKQTGLWSTQPHNEPILDQAFRTSPEVYLIFGANKQGGFCGYAVMRSAIKGTKPAGSISDPKSPSSRPTFTHLGSSGTQCAVASPRELDPDEEIAFPPPSPLATVDEVGHSKSEPVPNPHALEGPPKSKTLGVTSPDNAAPADDDGIKRGDIVVGTPEKGDERHQFHVEWIQTRHLPFHRIRHLRNPWNQDKEVKVCCKHSSFPSRSKIQGTN